MTRFGRRGPKLTASAPPFWAARAIIAISVMFGVSFGIIGTLKGLQRETIRDANLSMAEFQIVTTLINSELTADSRVDWVRPAYSRNATNLLLELRKLCRTSQATESQLCKSTLAADAAASLHQRVMFSTISASVPHAKPMPASPMPCGHDRFSSNWRAGGARLRGSAHRGSQPLENISTTNAGCASTRVQISVRSCAVLLRVMHAAELGSSNQLLFQCRVQRGTMSEPAWHASVVSCFHSCSLYLHPTR